MIQYLQKNKGYILLGLILLMCGIMRWTSRRDTLKYDNTLRTQSDFYTTLDNTQKDDDLIKVPLYICGEVNRPGVYWLTSNELILDAINVAGGITEDAWIEGINLAEQIRPNQKIYIPKEGEEIDKSYDSYDNSSKGINQTKYININTADANTLQQLPGIGVVKANQIIDYRTTNGPFRQKIDLQKVSGIGEKTYSLIEGLISAE